MTSTFEYECLIFDGPHVIWSGYMTAEEAVRQAWYTIQGLDEGFFHTFVVLRGDEVVLRTDVDDDAKIRDFEIAAGLLSY